MSINMSLASRGFSAYKAPLPDVDSYIYLHHVDTYIILPGTYNSDNNDSISVSFKSSTPLQRTAPIYSYANSGPRTLQISFTLHRDMMLELNYKNKSYAPLVESEKIIGSDGIEYIDYAEVAARQIQAAALPKYSTSEKMVNPPIVSLKLGSEIFIKGVVTGNVGVSYGLPLLRNNKLATVKIGFSLSEIIPYDAESAMELGSYRGISSDLSRDIAYKTGSLNSNYIGSQQLMYA